MPFSRAVWRDSGMQASQTPLPAYCSQHAGISSSALAQACGEPPAPGFSPAPSSPKPVRGIRKRWAAELLLARTLSIQERDRGHGELRKSRGKRGGAAEKPPKLLQYPTRKLEEKFAPYLRSLPLARLRLHSVLYTYCGFYLMNFRSENSQGKKKEEHIQREAGRGGEPHLQKLISQTSCESLSRREPRTSRPEWITTYGILWSTLGKWHRSQALPDFQLVFNLPFQITSHTE